MSLISKKTTLHVLHTFFVHFFAVVLHDYDVKPPDTSQLRILSCVQMEATTPEIVGEF